MKIDVLKMELSEMLLPLELQYRKHFEGYYNDQNILKFIYANRDIINTDIETIKARLFTPPVTDSTDNQIRLNEHYFWAQLVYNLKGLLDDNLPPMFGD